MNQVEILPQQAPLASPSRPHFECRICGNADDNRPYEAPELMYGFRDVHLYFQCAHCQCLQIAQFPPDIERYYGGKYYSYQSRSSTALKSALIRSRDAYAMFGAGWIGAGLCRAFPTDEYDFLQPLRSTLSKDHRILDVGCGAGALLRAMRRVGFGRLDGIDPFGSEDGVIEPGLTIRKTFIHDLHGTYDLVMFHHSLEHVPDQLATLQSAFRLLAPGGQCVVRIPTVSSYAWRQYGIHWVQLDAPRHYFLHSRQSMSLIAAQAGFEVASVVCDGTAFQFWGSEQYASGIALRDRRSYWVNPRASMFSKADMAQFTERAKAANAAGEGDQCAFYLRKPPLQRSPTP